MNYSYAMGVDPSIQALTAQGFTVTPDGENYMVSFPEDKAGVWEAFILSRLKTGFWNDYLTDDGVVFLFLLPEGVKRCVVRDYQDDQVLALCEKLCGRKFESMRSMLTENPFYREILES
ncbi:MAG: hypothetical protein PHO41_00605 [Eubacteriales bacterium]|nr:hypothetical protein [Eubacteriales bacterium]